MAKYAPRIPISVTDGEPSFSINRKDWSRIEAAYGQQLPPDVRAGIFSATTNFVLFEASERGAEPLSAAKRRIESIRDGAKALFDIAVGKPATAATSYADVAIERHLGGLSLCGALMRINSACNAALKDVDDPSLRGHQEGEYWNRWIRALTQVLKAAGLPTAISKAELAEPLPFQRLIYELERCVPATARRHTGGTVTADALTQAIYRARRKVGGDTKGQKS